ncbi:MAG: hypothetical protein QOJ84_2521 [Bradyrhizobium sp.]|nr:hypothetical protein [Bradyrhizobium sp.]
MSYLGIVQSLDDIPQIGVFNCNAGKNFIRRLLMILSALVNKQKTRHLLLLVYVPGRDTSVSFDVMNSSSTGTPSFVFAMPRFIAGTMSSGFVTRSP